MSDGQHEAQDAATLYRLLPDAIKQELATLTEKQRDYAILLAHDVPKVEAYTSVYSVRPDTKESSIVSAATNVAAHPKIKAAVALMQSAAPSAGAIAEEIPLTRDWVLKRLGEEAEDLDGNSGSVRVRALELIGRSQGMFEEVQVIKDERPKTAEEAERQIMQIIGELVTGRRHLPGSAGLSDGLLPATSEPEYLDPDTDDGT